MKDKVNNNVVYYVNKLQAIKTLKNEEKHLLIDIDHDISENIGIKYDTLRMIKGGNKGTSLITALKIFKYFKELEEFKDMQFTDMFYIEDLNYFKKNV